MERASSSLDGTENGQVEMASEMPGAGLPGLSELPEEILQIISNNFDAAQWARGPSLTCHRLYQMPLTRLAMPSLAPLLESEDEYRLTDIEGAEFNQKIVSGLKWIAGRTSAATRSLTLAFTQYGLRAGFADAFPWEALFHNIAPLSKLRFLNFSPHLREGCLPDLAREGFLVRLLIQAPRIEAVIISVRTGCIPDSGIYLKHLRHLIMTRAQFQCPFLVAKQLPVLETLYLDKDDDEDDEEDDEEEDDEDDDDFDVGVLDMSGCKGLKRLVLCNAPAQNLLWDTAGSGPCPLALEFPDFKEPLDPRSEPTATEPEPLSTQAALAQQLVIHDFRCVYNLLGASPNLQVLTLRWRHPRDVGLRDIAIRERKPRSSLASCMPANGQPMLNLKTIIITDCTRLLDFPGPQQLPNLKELVMKTSGSLEVEFEDAVATVAGLDSLLLFGQPLCPSGEDMMSLMAASGVLAMRGLVLGSAAGAQQSWHSSSCLYLRPLGARELTIQELSTKVEQLVQCRCGACFGCLQRAGCIEG